MRQTCRRTRPNEAEAGFTLAEMLVVVAILALAAGLVVGHGLPGREAVSRAALASWLRDARAQAMERGQGVAITVRPGGQELEAGDSSLDFGPGWRVSIDGEIVFAPDGTTDGGVVLARGPGQDLAVQVAPLVGRVD